MNPSLEATNFMNILGDIQYNGIENYKPIIKSRFFLPYIMQRSSEVIYCENVDPIKEYLSSSSLFLHLDTIVRLANQGNLVAQVLCYIQNGLSSDQTLFENIDCKTTRQRMYYIIGKTFLELKFGLYNISYALYWLSKSAELGDADALYELGRIYLEDTEIENNYQLAMEYWTHASHLGNEKARQYVDKMLRHECGLEIFNAVNALYQNDQYYNSTSMEAEHTQTSPEEEEELFNILKINEDYLSAFFNASDMRDLNLFYKKLDTDLTYKFSVINPLDLSQIFKNELCKATFDNSDSQCLIGYMFSKGIGCDKDEKLALKWLQKAAWQDHAVASFLATYILMSKTNELFKKKAPINLGSSVESAPSSQIQQNLEIITKKETVNHTQQTTEKQLSNSLIEVFSPNSLDATDEIKDLGSTTKNISSSYIPKKEESSFEQKVYENGGAPITIFPNIQHTSIPSKREPLKNSSSDLIDASSHKKKKDYKSKIEKRSSDNFRNESDKSILSSSINLVTGTDTQKQDTPPLVRKTKVTAIKIIDLEKKFVIPCNNYYEHIESEKDDESENLKEEIVLKRRIRKKIINNFNHEKEEVLKNGSHQQLFETDSLNIKKSETLEEKSTQEVLSGNGDKVEEEVILGEESAPELLMEKAKNPFDEINPEKKICDWLRFCDLVITEGSKAASVKIGRAFQAPFGFTTNYTKAFEYELALAKSGNVESQFIVGVMLYRGYGCTKNEQLAFEWLAKAASQDHPISHTLVAQLLEGSDIPRKDLIDLHKRSYDLGVYNAKLNINKLKFDSIDVNSRNKKLSKIKNFLDFDSKDTNSLIELCQVLKECCSDLSNFEDVYTMFSDDPKLLEEVFLKISTLASKNIISMQYLEYLNLYKVAEKLECKVKHKIISPENFRDKVSGIIYFNPEVNGLYGSLNGDLKVNKEVYTRFDFRMDLMQESYATEKNHLISYLNQKEYEGAFLASLHSIEFNRDQEWDVFVFHLLKKIAEKGVAQAQCHLGLMYFAGIWVTQDFAMAAQWLEKANSADIPLVQYLLGYMYYNGLGVKEDLKKATLLFSQAEHKELQIKSGKESSMYMRQTGLRLGCTRTIKEIEKEAQKTKSPYLFYLLATMNKLGDGLEKNIEKSFTYFKKSCPRKSKKSKTEALAKYEMAKILREESFSGSEQYSWKELLQQSADANFPKASILNLVESLKDNNKECDENIYQILLNHAETYEDGLAYYTLGEISKNRNSDVSQAIAFYKKAAELNNRDAQFMLGLGVTYGSISEGLKHRNEIAEYIKSAAQNGHPKAMKKRLTILNATKVKNPQIDLEIETLTYRLNHTGVEKASL